MIKHIIIPILLFVLISCTSTTEEQMNRSNVPKEVYSSKAIQISSGKVKAEAPYMTINKENIPVICWVEGEEENTILHYATLQKDGKSFSNPIEVSSTKGLSAHHESMPKLAFKQDGTVIVVFQIRKPTPKNRFAGAIYYTQSFDNGINWTNPMYLHSDTSHGIGRSFFDLANLPNGEIGAIWLDGRKRQRNGSTLYFSKTNGNEGFINDTEIAQTTCQCCRTDIYVDKKKNINIAFRDIINDSIRDIAYIVSSDNGNSFTEPTCISKDNWVIDGCPHTGPTMAWNKNGLQLFWFTAGGRDGVYQCSKNYINNGFSDRELLNPHARHPQVTTLKDESIAIVWDETFKTTEAYINRIGVQTQLDGHEQNVQYITPDTVDAHHPVTIGLDNGKLLIAWTQRNDVNSQIYYKIVNTSTGNKF